MTHICSQPTASKRALLYTAKLAWTRLLREILFHFSNEFWHFFSAFLSLSLSLSLVQSQQKSDIDSSVGQLTAVKHLRTRSFATRMTIGLGGKEGWLRAMDSQPIC
jgi:hypothetical protein